MEALLDAAAAATAAWTAASAAAACSSDVLPGPPNPPPRPFSSVRLDGINPIDSGAVLVRHGTPPQS